MQLICFVFLWLTAIYCILKIVAEIKFILHSNYLKFIYNFQWEVFNVKIKTTTVNSQWHGQKYSFHSTAQTSSKLRLDLISDTDRSVCAHLFSSAAIVFSWLIHTHRDESYFCFSVVKGHFNPKLIVCMCLYSLEMWILCVCRFRRIHQCVTSWRGRVCYHGLLQTTLTRAAIQTVRNQTNTHIRYTNPQTHH